MKNKELRELTVDELGVQYDRLKEELFNLRFQHATGQLENTARIKVVRRSIAQVMTYTHVAESKDRILPEGWLPKRKRTRRARHAQRVVTKATSVAKDQSPTAEA